MPQDPTPAAQHDLAPAGLVHRLEAVQERVRQAAEHAGRPAEDVRLMLASKTQPAPVVRVAVEAGARLLGENKVQELVAKGPDLADLSPTVHLIGHLQSNKVNAALRWAACVQSVDTLDLAERLSRRCEAVDRDLEVMVQVNVSGEESKYGVAPAQATALAAAVATLPRLRLTGLMTIGANSDEETVVRAGFAELGRLRDEVLASGLPGTGSAHELSMGMSGDLELAIAEGATMVRVGSAVFGARPAPV
ncbi:YggS family pyridoxal phosphate-dependent enzyme [Actinotalea sp. BY-33]|uniref:Pyridoxal phosphate homeostasis protein n=1 Tax=Actinotalea soli TaxID=2819234 RepID=A0A939RU13_9CELL|nr:YggS family pyridoxal phosphate-dependent enzyme [Actinotalea soli]MBO1750775.1 YggS family pyridoxal phosphate-dependent enzyme [Actinotalea soli]